MLMTHTRYAKQRKYIKVETLSVSCEMLGIKQDALAYELGEDWNQKKSLYWNRKETIETSYTSASFYYV